MCKFIPGKPELSGTHKKEVLIDLRGIGPNSYTSGEGMLGEIETLGQVVVRGDIINRPTNTSI